MEFKSVIVDECGTVIYWCEELLNDKQIETILDEHPGWNVRCITMEGDY